MTKHKLSAVIATIHRMATRAPDVAAQKIMKKVAPFLQDILNEKIEIKNVAKKVDSALDKFVIDEDDASNAEIITNYLVYALSDLCYYFIEGQEESLESVMENALEQVRFIETQEFFRLNGGKALVMTSDDIEKIESSQIVSNEKNIQEQ